MGNDKPRLIVTTDIGGDPDDQQSMIRLMTHANEFQIEGLIASSTGKGRKAGKGHVRADLIEEIVGAYGEVRGNLASHAEGFPECDHLLERAVAGNARCGMDAIGEDRDTDGSRLIVSVVDAEDTRPVNVAMWGGQTDLAQALWRVKNDRSEANAARFVSRLRIHDIGDQDDLFGWIHAEFPSLWYVLDAAPEGADKRHAVYRGMYIGGDEAVTSLAWLREHVIEGHGPLGALYPTETWTAPNPNGALKEGDTPSWFYFLDHGLSDPAHPGWGGWGGRFIRKEVSLFSDAEDTMGGASSPHTTVNRWRPAYQNAFEARMDWCVLSYEEANHLPRAVLNGDDSRRVLEIRAATGEDVRLDAAGSSDPDGDDLSYRWWRYEDADSYAGGVRIEGASSEAVTVHVPEDAGGSEIHVILEVTDDGTPPLTSYRRAVIGV